MKTLKKIAKERVKAEVISWVTEQDPMKGIIARDLIAQMLEGKDEKTLLRSTINVVTPIRYAPMAKCVAEYLEGLKANKQLVLVLLDY